MQVFNPKWREYDNYQSNDATCTTQGLKGPLVKEMQGIRGHAPTYQAGGPTGQPPRKGGEPGPTCQVRPNLAWPPLCLPNRHCMLTDSRRQSIPCKIQVGGLWGSAEPLGSAEPTTAPVGLLFCQGTPLQLQPINMRWGATESTPDFGYQTRVTLS